jgi:hypothetical protein
MNIVVIWGGCQWCSWSEQIFRYERTGKAREGMKFFERGEQERLFGRRGITDIRERGWEERGETTAREEQVTQ